MFTPLGSTFVKASESVSTTPVTGDKIYCTATLEDNFADDCVMVVLSNAASLSKTDYSTSDFSEINCKSTANLTEVKTNKVARILSVGDEAASLVSASENTQVSNTDSIKLDTFNQILMLELEETGKDKVLAAIKILEQRSDVLYAGPNYLYSIDSDFSTSNNDVSEQLQTTSSRAVTTNDTYASNQWAINKINLASAWQITTGMSNCVKVGIIDLGVDASHLDLEGRVSVSESRRIYHTGHINTTGATDDTHGHGTMIAGIIGAIPDNSIGITGINWNTNIVSLNLYDNSNLPTTASFVEAVNYAENIGIKILNCSLNVNMTSNSCEEDEGDICIYHCVLNFDGLVICSAGNENTDINTNNVRWLTSLDLDNIIVVGASTENDTLWYTDAKHASNYGSRRVDLFAPGAMIYSTMSGDVCPSNHNSNSGYHVADGYHRCNGTSFAAPYVVGVASLIKAKYPNLSPEQIKNRIMRSVDMCTAFYGKCVSGGRLNAYKALHNHSFTVMHDTYNSSYHKSYCACGAYDLLPHNWVTMGDFEACSDCSYVMQ